MSEAESHILKARLVGGVLNKAQRGELKLPLPIGLVYDEDQRVVLEPDQQVRQSLKMFFETFERTGSAWATVQAFGRAGLKFPKRGQAGTGEIAWQELSHANALDTLRNPRYAGVFCYGRTRCWKDAQGKWHSRQVPREKWRFVKLNAHPGYITWEEFLAHQERLLQNYQAHGGKEGRLGPPREGPALLQGLVLCGNCGRAMTVHYHRRRGRLVPDYVCRQDLVQKAQPLCQRIPGGSVDEAVSRLLVQSVTPLALEVALQVQEEIQARLAEADRLRQQQVERAQYEADRARLRYMRVDPNNRLVADTLETLWNEKLRFLAQAKEDYEREHQRESVQLGEEHKAKILALASDFPKLWCDPKTPDRDRKRMVRLLVEDVTLRRDGELHLHIRFRGGATEELHLPLPKRAWELQKTKPEIVAEIDRLLDEHTDGRIAQMLNERGWHSSSGHRFTWRIINNLCRAHHIKPRLQRLRERALLTAGDVAAIIGGPTTQVSYWRRVGLLRGVRLSEKNEHFYYPPSQTVIEDIQRRRLNRRGRPLNAQRSLLGAI